MYYGNNNTITREEPRKEAQEYKYVDVLVCVHRMTRSVGLVIIVVCVSFLCFNMVHAETRDNVILSMSNMNLIKSYTKCVMQIKTYDVWAALFEV